MYLIKHKGYKLLFLLLFLVLHDAKAQQLTFPDSCTFKTGDDLQWANLDFNDQDWQLKKLAQSWGAADKKLNVYAWYRIKLFIPASWKKNAEKYRELKLNLGKIDDVDQTFFNGKLIGATGKFPPDYVGKWDTEREYRIPIEAVQWDKENLIAVRIFSPDFGGVGMYAGPYRITPVAWPDFMQYKDSIIRVEQNGCSTVLAFNGKKDFSFEGNVEYRIKDLSGKILYTETKPIHLSGRSENKTTLHFNVYTSNSTDFFKVGYIIRDSNSTVEIEKEQFFLTNTNVQLPIGEEVIPAVDYKMENLYMPVPFQNQQMTGYLGKRMQQNLRERLLKVDEHGLTGSYLSRPGIHPWAGEHIGKYLETAVNTWKITGDQQLKKQLDRMLYILIHTQLDDGYLGTYTPEDYWTSWDVWSHKYNLIGLMAYYAATGYQPALAAAEKIGNLLCKTFGNQPGQQDIIKAGEHQGMAATSVLEPMTELYKYTGQKKYLDFCYYLLGSWEQENGPKIISQLLATGDVTKVGNGKAYEMISNFVGLIKLYRLTGDKHLLEPALIAWQNIADKKMYITGTASSWEYFQKDEVLPASVDDHMGEGCVTTTWLQFNQSLLELTGDLKYYHQIEKTIYNHLLAAENPQTGCVSYYTPLIGQKPYTCYITCCQSSVPRGIALIPNFTFGQLNHKPVLLSYENARYKEIITTDNKVIIGMFLKVQSNFPETGKVVITVQPTMKEQFTLVLRVPAWCTSFVATVGNKIYKGIANEYLEINRVWKSEDKILVNFAMPVQQLNGGKSYPGQIAFQRGPQVLAFDEIMNQKIKVDSNRIYNSAKLETGNELLPKPWIGKQLYKLQLNDKKIINLVPFADAGQTGGTIKVWLPFTPIK